MKKHIFHLFKPFILLAALSLIGCSKEKENAKSMEQIYSENGVPVRVKEVKKGDYEINLSYNTILSGIHESVVYATYGDRVDKINVKIGEYVKKDRILLSFPTDNPSANYFQAKTAYENSKKTMERYENLFRTGGISQQTLDNIKTQFNVDQANWDAVKQGIDVKAPIGGYVTIINVRETENVKAKQALMTISNTDTLKAKLNVAEKDIDFIKKGTKVEAEWNGNKVSGKIVEVDLAMDPSSKSFSAYLEIPNAKGLLRAGVTAQITVSATSQSNVITLDRKNVVKHGDNYFSYVAKDGKAKEVSLTIGKDRGLFLEITGGINEGDMLITEGQMFLADGTKIKIIR